MESKRVFLAIVLSLAILFGYQIFLVPPPAPPDQAAESASPAAPAQEAAPSAQAPVPMAAMQAPGEQIPTGRDIAIETSLYSAVLSEVGGGVKSFRLKNYRVSLENHEPVDLVKTDAFRELPLFFSWGATPQEAMIPGFRADQPEVRVQQGGRAALDMSGSLAGNIEIRRRLEFQDDGYQMQLEVEVRNTGEMPVQGAPYLSLTNLPFSGMEESQWLFTGPAFHRNQELTEIKVDDLEEKQVVQGPLDWVAYEDPYFMNGLIPLGDEKSGAIFMALGKEKVATLLTAEAAVIQPQSSKTYRYLVYFGPKKLSILKPVSENLHRIVDFGWYDFLARPTLYLLNMLYGVVHNYGIAIILVTILFKLALWPISLKGMKSMKTMQKLQPKMAKLREKYKDDRERLNREMMQLYQTYKVNPLGGCLPMLLQIPVFFALYKVLLQAIELRHAPFLLWINDLSAPDRLYIGFDIPWLGGIPVLTLLMGASMYLQQKMTPTAADPAQAKIMLYLPVIFTFMFLNFASGLVLYWFVNNLLSIGQQYMVNRQPS